MKIQVFMSDESVKKLKTKVLRQSSGMKVAKGDLLYVNYAGTLLNGEQFDSSFDFQSFRPSLKLIGSFPANFFQYNDGLLLEESIITPLEIPVLGEGMIEGFSEGLIGSRIGEVVQLTIPADLAYGDQELPGIPANSPLRFTVEVLAAKPADSDELEFPDLRDIGVNPKKLGISDKDLSGINQIKVGLDSTDRLIGDNANDLLIGVKGNDQLMGAGGADLLIGGKGKNRFFYSDFDDSPDAKNERDKIFDFGKKDKINLRAMASELQFIGDDKFSGAAGDVRFAKETLSIDADGDKSADFAILMPGTAALKESNLLL